MNDLYKQLIKRCEERRNGDITVWCEWEDDVAALIMLAKVSHPKPYDHDAPPTTGDADDWIKFKKEHPDLYNFTEER